MMRNFKLFGAMLVFLVSLESCKGCAVGAGAGTDAGCPAGQEQINGACVAKCPADQFRVGTACSVCPAGQIDIDDKKTCKALVAVADKLALIAEIKKAIGFGTGTTADPATNWTANLNYIDTSKVTDMSNLFADKTRAGSYTGYNLEKFNGRIDKWNTSNVTDMQYMFSDAPDFNQDISNWDVSSVTNMNNMFSSATNFNQNISKWNVSNVTDMAYMFNTTNKFNQPIGKWNVNSVTTMMGMFAMANAFDQDLSRWTPVAAAGRLGAMFTNGLMFKNNNLGKYARWWCTKTGTTTNGC